MDSKGKPKQDQPPEGVPNFGKKNQLVYIFKASWTVRASWIPPPGSSFLSLPFGRRCPQPSFWRGDKLPSRGVCLLEAQPLDGFKVKLEGNQHLIFWGSPNFETDLAV